MCIIPVAAQNGEKTPKLSKKASWLYTWENERSNYLEPFHWSSYDHQNRRLDFQSIGFFPKSIPLKLVDKDPRPINNGKTFYVGGKGPENYTNIHYAIFDARDGDTVFVYDDSAPYYENSIRIDKSIRLIGENRNTTIIDGKQKSWGIEIDANGVVISGFTIQNNGDPVFNPFNDGGIMIFSSNNVITENNIINSCYGIVLSGSVVPANNNTISNNIILSNSNCGAYIQQSNHNKIALNTFLNNGLLGGLILDELEFNNVSGNEFYNDSVYIYYAHHNTFLNNLVNNKPLLYLEDKSDLVIEDEVGQVILINCDHITMQNKDVSNTTVGFLLYNTNHCLLSDNIINSSDYCGILLYGSSNYNTISNNTISHDYYGIGIRSSNGNTIVSNKISRNIFRGITILYSNSNNVLSNFFFDNNLGVDVQGNSEFNNISGNTFLDDGVWVYNAWNNIFLDNYVNDKPLLYLEGKSDRVINESTGQIILVSCDRIEVKNQDISNTNTGILLMDTHHCVMHENTLRANKGYNIFLSHSNDNDIFANSITYSSFGITFDISDNNIIHHNIISTHGLDGIYLYGSNKNNISQNTIKDNRGHGIFLYDHSNNNSISSNTIESNGGKFWSANYGVFLSESSDNRIEYNNILKNARDARFAESYSNIWNGNYWNRPRILPKIILGETAKILFDLRINFDWHPALKPYDIPQMS